jgi:transposase InsO family protein
VNHKTPNLDDKVEIRFQAVLTMLKGEPVSQITTQFGICRSDLYKFRGRALKAMRYALCDHPRGPKNPHNRLCKAKEENVKSACERHPTLSSYKINEKLGSDSPCPRTIQRVRKRLSLPRLPKRTPPKLKAKRFSKEEKEKASDYIRKQDHLGVLRLSWDIANILKIPISASTVLRWRKKLRGIPTIEVIRWQFYERKHPHSLWHGDLLKFEHRPNWGHLLHQMTLLDDYSRGYVFCELTTIPTARYTIQCLIRAMRQWKVIPKAVLFDNGAEFKANLVKSFCKNLGIQIIYITVGHPQTNGKIERAFRDDKRDFYDLRKDWSIEDLQKDLSDYVYYRNHQRGHWALKGSPAITRLREQDRFAPPSLLDRLEEYAVCEAGEKSVDSNGYIRMFRRTVYLGKQFSGCMVKCFETMNGLELRNDGLVIGTLPNYQEYRRLYNGWHADELLPQVFMLQRDQKLS